MPPPLSDLAKYTFLVVGALFPIVNPVGNTPIFLSLTQGLSSHGRAVLARMIALNGLVLILTSIFIGTHILAFFGISLPVVQVGGGLVVISTGWSLLRSEPDQSPVHAEKKITSQDIANRAFYPLTLPLTVGPGSISVALTIGANQSPHRNSLTRLIASVIGTALVALTVYLSYRFAERVARLLGQTAMNVIVRLTSFILLCIGVQIMWNGVRALALALR